MTTDRQKRDLADRIREAIFLSHARDEGPLNEDLLADQFGVSRTPIREALEELERDGLIERRQKKGIVLRKFSRREVAELFDIRELLEVYAFHLACERAGEKDLGALREIGREVETAIERKNAWEADQWDMRFHSRLIDIADNSYLVKLVKTLHLLSQAFQVSTQLVDPLKGDGKLTHDQIVDALEKKDRDGGERILREHIRRSKAALMERIGR